MQLHSKIFITGLAFKYKAQVQRFFRMVHEKTTNSGFGFFFFEFTALCGGETLWLSITWSCLSWTWENRGPFPAIPGWEADEHKRHWGRSWALLPVISDSRGLGTQGTATCTSHICAGSQTSVQDFSFQGTSPVESL